MEGDKLIECLRNNPSYELELRMGKLSDKKFISGVDYELFNDICDDLVSCDKISYKDESWQETMDVFFDHMGEEYRTRVSYPSSNMKINSETIKKKRVHNINILQSENHAFRVSLSNEQIVRDEKIPAIVKPKYVRLKHTKRFFLNSGDKKTWCIFVNKIWGGEDRTKVENMQHTETPCYEVECELVDTNTYLNNHSNKHVFDSILMKGFSLLGVPQSKYKIIYS